MVLLIRNLSLVLVTTPTYIVYVHHEMCMMKRNQKKQYKQNDLNIVWPTQKTSTERPEQLFKIVAMLQHTRMGTLISFYSHLSLFNKCNFHLQPPAAFAPISPGTPENFV